MKQLAQNNSLSPALTAIESEMIIASTSMQIKDLHDKDCIDRLNSIIAKAHADCGMDIAKKGELSSMAIALGVLEDAREYFPGVTLDEIAIAVKNGIRKAYGEFYGINVTSIHQFIKAYRISQDRADAIRKQKIYADEQQAIEDNNNRKLSDQEQFKYMAEACQSALETYKTTGKLIDFGSAKYLFLEQYGLISLTIERKNEIYKRAKVDLDLIKSREPAKCLTLLDTLTGVQQTTKQEYIAHARLLALREYFEMCKELELNLLEELQTLNP
jgi:hypothetical protein